MAALLVVEDEVAINNLIMTHLQDEGHTVVQAFDGPSALAAVEANKPQLIILDWMLPGLDGLSVCRRIRQNYLMPIIMLTARDEEIDRLMGLEVGADDYISKPFSIRELMARVRAMLRRVELDNRAASQSTPTTSTLAAAPNPKTLPEAPVITFGALVIKTADRIATVDDVPLDLTPKEFELLEVLTANPNRAFSREYLLHHIWGYEFTGFDRTVDAHITRLRKKLGSQGDRIATVWGVGYRFSA